VKSSDRHGTHGYGWMSFVVHAKMSVGNCEQVAARLSAQSRLTGTIRSRINHSRTYIASAALAQLGRPEEGVFRKDEFRYDTGRDDYVCPAGKVLTPIRHGRLRDLAKVDCGNRGACRDCPMRARCTNDVRSVSRLENEAVLDRMAERLKKRPEILDRRREVVEHPFGSIKQCCTKAPS
jgi:hypothetical protein